MPVATKYPQDSNRKNFPIHCRVYSVNKKFKKRIDQSKYSIKIDEGRGMQLHYIQYAVVLTAEINN